MATGMRAKLIVAWGVVRGLPAALRGLDLALRAAALTFYAGIAVVPVVVLAGWVVARLAGEERLRRLGGSIADALPDTLGAPGVVTALVAASVALTPWTALAGIFPASLYGEGLRRAFVSLVPGDDTWTGWRGRLLLAPALLAAPGLLFALLLIAPTVSGLFGSGGWARVLGVIVAFLTDWILVSIPLLWTYRVVGPARPRWAVTLVGAFATGSFLAGFVQGFVLFLSIPVDLGVPFGGFDAVGAAVAVGFWLYLLHVIVLIGYVATLRLDDAVGMDCGARAVGPVTA